MKQADVNHTPLTDAEAFDYRPNQFGGSSFRTTPYGLLVEAKFARQLEIKLNQKNILIDELKEAIDLLIEDRDSYHEENNELRKDKERLDWLINNAYIQFYKVDDGGEWEMELDASDARNHIDKEMEDAQ